MSNEFEVQKIKSKYPEIFDSIPSELINSALSEKTASQISEICLKSEIGNEEKIEKVAYQIGLVLLGQLPPGKLTQVLEKKLKLERVIAEKIYLEASRLIFSQIKEGLDKLYGKGVLPTKPETAVPSLEKKLKKPLEKDVYREPIE